MRKKVDLWLDLRRPSLREPARHHPAGSEEDLRPDAGPSRLALCGKSGHGRTLIDLAYPRFFKRELDYEDRGAVLGLLTDAGVDAVGEGPAELKRHQTDAEQQGVFAVPTFVVEGELFWGQDRIDFVRAKLTA